MGREPHSQLYLEQKFGAIYLEPQLLRLPPERRAPKSPRSESQQSLHSWVPQAIVNEEAVINRHGSTGCGCPPRAQCRGSRQKHPSPSLFPEVQFSCSVMSDSLQPHGLQHTRLPCPSLSPGACSNSCSLSWWWHPTISFSVIPSPPALKLSQHQGLFQWVGSSHHVAKVLGLQLHHQYSQWIF